MNWNRAIFPSLKRRGGCAINKMDPFRNGAAGVVSSAKLFRPEDFAELTTITASRYRARASRPSAALSVASQLLVDAAATPSSARRGILHVQHFFNSFTSSMAAGIRLILRKTVAHRAPIQQAPQQCCGIFR